MNDDRIARLEVTVRRQRVMLAVLAVLLALFELVIPLSRGTVSARAFVLRAGGATRAQLAASPTGTPTLSLYDSTGAARLTLAMRENGAPDITMTDAAGRVRAAFRVSEHGVPSLFMTDGTGAVRAAMGVPTDGLPTMVLLGERDRVRYMTP